MAPTSFRLSSRIDKIVSQQSRAGDTGTDIEQRIYGVKQEDAADLERVYVGHTAEYLQEAWDRYWYCHAVRHELEVPEDLRKAEEDIQYV